MSSTSRTMIYHSISLASHLDSLPREVYRDDLFVKENFRAVRPALRFEIPKHLAVAFFEVVLEPSALVEHLLPHGEGACPADIRGVVQFHPPFGDLAEVFVPLAREEGIKEFRYGHILG